MESLKQRWRGVPSSIRKPTVLVIGMLFVIAAGLTGWLPGPGGLPLFLIGIAILATEYDWAKRLRDRVMAQVRIASSLFRQHKLLGIIMALVSLTIVVSFSWFMYTKLR